MIRFWKKRLSLGIINRDTTYSKEIKAIRKKIKRSVNNKFSGSLALRMVDSGSCNACEAECTALSNPYYNLGQLGINFVASPRHADVLLLSGSFSFNMKSHVIEAYNQIPNPKWVVTLGDCPTLKSPIKKSFAITAPAEDHLKVDYNIPGCPPDPDQIIKGLLKFLELIE